MKTFIVLVGGGAVAALYWLREIHRGWQIDRAIARGEELPDE